MFRIGNVRYPDPAYFGRARTYRFDAPDQSYGVCYLGTTLACCLLETIPLRKRRRSRTLFIHADVLQQRYVAYATARRDLRLAWFADVGLVRNGADLRITGGDNYTLSRRWSKACHDHTLQLDGILYPSANPLDALAHDRSRALDQIRRPSRSAANLVIDAVPRKSALQPADRARPLDRSG